VRTSKLNGILVASGTRNLVQNNRVLSIDGVGIEVRGDANTILHNVIVSPTVDGIFVSAGAHTVTGNSVSKAGQVGILVTSSDNAVRANTVSSSVVVDLRDSVEGTNTYSGNKLKTTDPPNLPH
jgi:parallel beta-helix repeat protein